MPFYAVVWCSDCNGVDFEGCFDGDVERHGPFDTSAAADEVGKSVADMCPGIWKYEVEEKPE